MIDNPKFAVLNADDPASEIYEKSTAAHVITYGIDHPADIHAKNIQMTSAGTSFELVLNRCKVYPMKIQLIGRFSVYNVLASIAAAFVSNIPMRKLSIRLKMLKVLLEDLNLSMLVKTLRLLLIMHIHRIVLKMF